MLLVYHKFDIGFPPVPHQFRTRSPPVNHQFSIISPPVSHQFLTSFSPVFSSVSNQFPTGFPSVPHQFDASFTSESHQFPTSLPSVRQILTIFPSVFATPVSRQLLSSTHQSPSPAVVRAIPFAAMTVYCITRLQRERKGGALHGACAWRTRAPRAGRHGSGRGGPGRGWVRAGRGPASLMHCTGTGKGGRAGGGRR